MKDKSKNYIITIFNISYTVKFSNSRLISRQTSMKIGMRITQIL